MRLPRIGTRGRREGGGRRVARGREGLFRETHGAGEHEREYESGAGRRFFRPGRDSAIPFRNVEEIAAKANNSIYGLAAGVWTRDIKKAHRIASLLRAGTVWINCYNVFDAALPFGGYKQSGWGREMGHEVLEQYTEVKAVCMPISSLGNPLTRAD